jgi:lipoprotein-anchoring transpeptidase ErfK/SrfK
VRLLAVGVGVLALALAGCSGGSSPTTPINQAADQQGAGNGQQADPGGSGGKASAPVVPPAQLAVKPGNGAQGVNPAAPISVVASAGTLAAVTVKSPAGKAVQGKLSADRTTWTSSEVLGYSKTYAVTATAVNSAGQSTKKSSTFSTVTPATFTMPYLFPSQGIKTVGIGQPITVHFDEAITDQAAAEKALKVTTSPPTQGGWYWFDNQNVHWRPKNYWTPGTHVTVSANVYGVNVGRNIYGQQDVSTSFTIGAARVFTINNNTHSGVVKVNGKTVKSIPVSMGRGGQITVNGKTIYFSTQSGPHVVQEKYSVKHMDSSSYGLPVDSPLGYSEDIPLAVRISASGEFVHAASWSVGDQGVRNVSHGCVNISPANADWFYHNFTYGDIVDIKNTGVPLARTDKYGDWMIPWSEWYSGSALH